MNRRGTKQTGKFDVQAGMVFTMPELKNIHPKKTEIQADKHPWLIANTYEDYVEIVMCTTLGSDIEDKHRFDKLDFDDTTDILHPCPPMDPPNTRTSGVSLDTAMLLPKRTLFTHAIHILNESTPKRNFTTEGTKSLCLNAKDLRNIQSEIFDYQRKNPQHIYDPFECEEHEAMLYDLEDGLPVPDWFSKEYYDQQFAWRHLPKADWKAVYPFEDQMHDYEKSDPKLLNIARLKKSGSRRKYSREEIIRKAEELSGRIQDTPYDGYQKD